MYPSYSIQALRWKQLSSLSQRSTIGSRDSSFALDTPSLSSASLRDAQQSLLQALNEKEWLLEEDQHLQVPPTHLDGHQGRIFGVQDFLKKTDRARERDVELCAVDEQGNRKLLTSEQLEHLKQTGELDVPSELFEDQHHTWKVAPGFYSGRQTVSESLGEGVGSALGHYIVYTKDAVVDKNASRFRPTMRKAVDNGFVKAFKKIREASGQLFVGRLVHRTYPDYLIDKVMQGAEQSYVYYHLRDHDTRCLFEFESLGVSVNEEGKNQQYWEILENEGHAEFAGKYRRSPEDCKKVSESRQQIASMKRIFDERMESKRNVKLNVDKVRAFEDPQKALMDLDRAEEEWRNAKEEAWLDHLRNISDKDVKELGQLEADRLLAIQVEKEVAREDDREIESQLSDYKNALKKRHRLLYLSKAWRDRKMSAKRQKIEASLQESRPERITQRLEEDGLTLQSAARKLAIEFRQEVRDPMRHQLQQKRSAFPPATFRVLQLDPNNWAFNAGGSINKYKKVEVDLGKHFWRLRYTLTMAIALTKGMIGGAFHFLVAGPLSIRALVSPRPYYATQRPVRDEKSFTQTLVSRLKSFYAALLEVRARFDASPDTGLIGKSIQSFFLRMYLAVKRTVGTCLIVTFMSVGTILATAFSFVVLTLAPLLAIGATLLVALFNLTIYDTALAAARNRACCDDDEILSGVSPLVKIGVSAPYYFVVPGVSQAALTILRIALHPMIGTGILSWSSLRYLTRSLRDAFTWFFVQKYSRMPSSDTFLAWRINGPGVAHNEYYRLPVDAAKVGVLLMLDRYRLCAHAEVRRAELDAPYHRYSELFRQLSHPFGVNISLGTPSPSTVASGLTWKTRTQRGPHISHGDPSFVPRMAEHPLDIWDTIGENVRASHPDFREAQERHIKDQWETNEMFGESLADGGVPFAEDSGLNELQKSELGEMVCRTARLLVEWNRRIDYCEKHLIEAISIPPSYQGRFRMAEAELQDLWAFTLSAVDLYGQQLKEELQEILQTSAFAEDIRQTVDRVTDTFYSSSGARPSKDIPVVAAFLLQKMLGGFDKLATLETVDRNLVLSPKLSKEDEHLIFWKTVSGDSFFNVEQDWVVPWPEE